MAMESPSEWKSAMETMNNPVSPISILLVEDEKDALDSLIAILTRKFPDTVFHTASNGTMGLELFRTNLPDIVITDINMPEMGGVQMVNKIREVKCDTKFIVITADNGEATMEHAVGKGFEIDYYIMKPVNFALLSTAIEQCLAQIIN